MDLLKKVIANKVKSTLINTTKHTKVYKEGQKEKALTRFIFTSSTTGKTTINHLKQIKHPNILHVVKSKEEKNNTYIKTALLFPIKSLSDGYVSYQHYMISVLSDLIVFLKRCDLSHNGIHMENFYCDGSGRFVLAGFEDARREDSQNDEFMFFEVMKAMNIENVKNDKEVRYEFKTSQDGTNQHFDNLNEKHIDLDFKTNTSNDQIYRALKCTEYTNLEDFINKNQKIFQNNIYNKLENAFVKFKMMSRKDKIHFLDFIIENKHEWINLVKRHIISIFVKEISIDDQVYKNKILTMIFTMDLTNYDEFIELLFTRLDSHVRLFLLHNIDFYIDRVTVWNDKLFENLILGLKCNDVVLQHESIKSINRISKKLDEKNIKETIKSLQYGSRNESIIEMGICFIDNIMENVKKNSSLSKETYRIIFIFMNNDAKRGSVMGLLSRIYDSFDCRKLQCEMLPALCNYLSDEVNQDLCFDLIDNILGFLKENKSEIVKDEWSVKRLGNLINKVNLKMPAFLSRKSSKNEVNSKTKKKDESEWDDNW